MASSSFRATLEEAIGADLLLHVADASHAQVLSQIEAVHEVLKELGCGQKDQLLLLNKIDLLRDASVRTVLSRRYAGALFTSASTGENAEEVISAVVSRVRGPQVRVTIEADCGNGKLMEYLARYAQVDARTFIGSSVRMEATLARKRLAALRSFGRAVKVRLEEQAV